MANPVAIREQVNQENLANIPINTAVSGLVGMVLTAACTSAPALTGLAIAATAGLISSIVYALIIELGKLHHLDNAFQTLLNGFVVWIPIAALTAIAFVYLGAPILLSDALAILIVPTIIQFACGCHDGQPAAGGGGA